jgi:hypothetical protein
VDRYLDVRLWLFWEERWSDQITAARVRKNLSRAPDQKYAVVRRFMGKTDILSFHHTVEDARKAMEDLRYKKWFSGKSMHTGLMYDVGLIV